MALNLYQALTALVDEWKKEVPPRTRITPLLEILDDQPGVTSTTTSDNTTMKIVMELEAALETRGEAMSHAETYASQYETKEELLKAEALKGFLQEISPV